MRALLLFTGICATFVLLLSVAIPQLILVKYGGEMFVAKMTYFMILVILSFTFAALIKQRVVSRELRRRQLLFREFQHRFDRNVVSFSCPEVEDNNEDLVENRIRSEEVSPRGTNEQNSDDMPPAYEDCMPPTYEEVVTNYVQIIG